MIVLFRLETALLIFFVENCVQDTRSSLGHVFLFPDRVIWAYDHEFQFFSSKSANLRHVIGYIMSFKIFDNS